MAERLNSDYIISQILGNLCKDVEEKLGGDVLLLRSPIQLGVDDIVRVEIERLAGREDKRGTLIVLLETPGGYVEVVERMHRVFRHHYQFVQFVIPNFAYSAGTVLALSGDEIWMDYYAVLGPVDPQVEKSERLLPGIGYLQKYKELIEKSRDGGLTEAETEFLLNKFDPAELFSLEQARKHSVSLITAWLVQYKFKDWTTRKTSGEPVTDEYKEQRAQDIAEILGNPKRWRSHARGIFMETLVSDEIKIKIQDLGQDEKLHQAVRDYYELFVDYCAKLGISSGVHTRLGGVIRIG